MIQYMIELHETRAPTNSLDTGGKIASKFYIDTSPILVSVTKTQESSDENINNTTPKQRQRMSCYDWAVTTDSLNGNLIGFGVGEV